MAEQPHRLGQRPAGQGVRAEAAVVDREAHRETLIAEVAIEGGEDLRADHALVDNGPPAQGGEVEVAWGLAPDTAGTVTTTAAQTEQQRLEGIAIAVGAEQPLLNHRSGSAGQRA